MEPRKPFDPLQPMPGQPLPSPFRPPGQYFPSRDDDIVRLLKEILDRLSVMEKRLKSIEESLKSHR